MKIAHIIKRDDKIIAQDLKDHLENVGALCREYMKKINCPTMGYVVGILHDIGKSGAIFQNRMSAIQAGEADPGQKGGHASAGAVILKKIAGNLDSPVNMFAVQAMCEAIFSHHTALPDNISPDGEDGYKLRLQCDEAELQEIELYLWKEIIDKEKLDKLLQQAYAEAGALFQKVKEHTQDLKEASFFLGMLEKMLLSALIDADWLDSAISGERELPSFVDTLKAETNYGEERKLLFRYFLGNLEKNLQKMSSSDKAINSWRNYISDSCKEAGNRNGGVYTLSCPTGAGKTLAVTRFAIIHAIEHNKDKIFNIIPYLSIIDQTTKSMKAALGCDASDVLVENNILELHSNIETDKKKVEFNNQENSSDTDFFVQRMTEPIVLTTMVRFLNTFFASGTRSLRPAHQFQNAVLIFDEIQTLPIKQIALFNSLINFLVNMCNCTCVLCTATQPLLGETVKPIYPIRMKEPSRLAELPQEAKEVFRRVQVKAELKNGGYSKEEMGDFIWDKAISNENVLVIMNTKNSVLAVYNEVVKRLKGKFKIYYLSTRLYAAHRKAVIEEIKEALLAKEKIIVVSTQLIEAGIDFDFCCVVRALAGMDSVVQAAGRCNREGKRKTDITYIVNPNDKLESLVHLKDIKEGARQAERLLREFDKSPELFDYDLLSEKAMHTYFQYYFWTRKEEMTYQIPKVTEYNLYDLLADNISLVRSGTKHSNYEVKALNQAFRTAADYFNVIEDAGNPIFVRRGRGKEIWEEIQRNTEYKIIKKLLKEAQQFVVNVPLYELKKLGESKGVVQWEDKMGMYVLNEMYYDEKTGLTEETGDTMPYYGF